MSNQNELVEKLLSEGASLFHEGNLVAAGNAFNKVLEVDPNNFMALARLSIVSEFQSPSIWEIIFSNPFLTGLYSLIVWPLFLQTMPFAGFFAPKYELDHSGFINKQGQFVFHQRVRVGTRISQGLWCNAPEYYERDKKAAFYDALGRKVFEHQFTNVEPFAEGFAAVKQGDKWGFVNRQGQVCINPTFQDVRSFSGGFAAAQTIDQWGFLDRSGNWAIKPQFENAMSFFEGRAAVSMNHKIGFIDSSGRFVIKPQFDEACCFSEGLSRVVSFVENGKRHRINFIDSSGKTVVNLNDAIKKIDTASDAWSFGSMFANNGYAPVFSNYLFAGPSLPRDEFTTFMSGPPFESCQFHNGLVPVRISGKYGYMDKRGDLMIPPQFESASSFNDRLALVTIDTKLIFPKKGGGPGPNTIHRYGFINTQGQFVIPPIYSYACGFSDGLARVDLGSKHKIGFVDTTGKTVFEIGSIGMIGEFNEGLAPVESWPYCNL